MSGGMGLLLPSLLRAAGRSRRAMLLTHLFLLHFHLLLLLRRLWKTSDPPKSPCSQPRNQRLRGNSTSTPDLTFLQEKEVENVRRTHVRGAAAGRHVGKAETKKCPLIQYFHRFPISRISSSNGAADFPSFPSLSFHRFVVTGHESREKRRKSVLLLHHSQGEAREEDVSHHLPPLSTLEDG